MAWDALGNIFEKKDKKEKGSTAAIGTEGTLSGQRPGENIAAPQQSYASFTGQGGSTGAPVRSGFVNFGTLFDLNKDAAGKMAQGAYDKAQGAVGAARDKLQGARDTFKTQYQQGTGKGTIGGVHGTEMSTPAVGGVATAPAKQEKHGTAAEGGEGSHISATNAAPNNNDTPTKFLQTPGAGSVVVMDNSLKDADAEQQQRESAATQAAAQQAALRAGRYGNILGDISYGSGVSSSMAPGGLGDANAIRPDAFDFNHYANELDAKSHAGQDYTGPDSIKGAIGEEDYAQLAKDLADAEAGTQGLTNSGGISTALGYEPSQEGEGKSALDTGLTQVAGQENFKRLADKTAGLSKELGAAQADSMKTAAAGKIQSAQAAKEWQDLLAQYEKDNAPKPAEEAPLKPFDQENLMAQWASFVGAGDPNSHAVNNITSSVGIEQQRAYNSMTEMGYTNDQIFAAFSEWTRLHGNTPPTAAQLAQIIIQKGGK